MTAITMNGFTIRGLHDSAQVHDRYAVGDVLDHGEIVGDEEIGQVELALQINQQIENLALDGNVERRDGLVTNDQFRVQRDRPRDTNSLSLPAGKFEREATDRSLGQPDNIQEFTNAFLAGDRVAETVNYERFFKNVTDRVAAVQ
jgi:hypothetical protein